MQSRASEPGSRPASATGQLFLRFLRFYPKSSHRPCPRGRGELGTPAQAREELLPLSPSSSPSCLPPPRPSPCTPLLSPPFLQLLCLLSSGLSLSLFVFLSCSPFPSSHLSLSLSLFHCLHFLPLSTVSPSPSISLPPSLSLPLYLSPSLLLAHLLHLGWVEGVPGTGEPEK